MGLELKSMSTEEALALPRLILPGGAHVLFTVNLESNPWPIRSEREENVGFALANLEEQRWRIQEASKASRANPKMSEQEWVQYPAVSEVHELLNEQSTQKRCAKAPGYS
jgi:hypothetical protein